MGREMYDVAVVGAGPAGATAARELATAGATVVVLEKENLPRYKTCGGGVVGRARRLLGVDIGPAVEREFSGATMSLLGPGLSFATSRSAPIVSMTMRASLDELLVRAAEKAGAEVQPATELCAVSASVKEVELVTSRGAIRAKFVVGADGAVSAVARLSGWNRETRRLVPAIEAELYVPDQDFARLGTSVRFDFDVPASGYAWVFPKREHLSVGILSMTPASGLRAEFARYRAAIGIGRALREERHGFVIPVAMRRDGIARARVLLVGDSAGLADPVTAEGISFAVQSGQLAAKALLAEQFDVNRVARSYERMVERTLAPELRAGRRLAGVLYGSPRVRTWLFRHYGAAMAEAVTDVFVGSRTYAGAIANPLNYVKLLARRRATSSRGDGTRTHRASP